jgi:3-hydroxy-3-methylglutaryl CoA synthase
LVGIAAYGAYIPRYRLGADTVGWNSRQERAVANFDEDSVTMAVAAGSDCLAGHNRSLIDGIVFASTTPPYAEKQCAAIVAAALDLRTDIFAVDVANVLRAGTNAVQTALDAVASGRAGRVLVVIADSRQGPPRGETERASGDGAAAFVIANQGVIAEHVGSHAVTDNMLDVWRSPGDPFVRTWEDRFATEEGIERIVPDAVSGYCQRTGIESSDVAKIALYAPDARRHARLARRLGFSDSQVQEPLFGAVGNTGAALVPMLLVGALENAATGDLLLAISYGDGSDVLGFEATADIATAQRPAMGLKGWVEAKQPLGSYETFARWRDVWTLDDASRRPAPASPSVSALWREADKNVRLYGARCKACGYVQYPPQRVCVECRSIGDTEPVRLSDKGGELFTYSMDYIAGAVDTPLVVAVVNFEGGGRVLCMMTDRELDEVRVGMPVEMSFRKLRVVNGIHNYYWKAIPRRSSVPIAV